LITQQSSSEENRIIGEIENLIQEFSSVRNQMEDVYGQTRILNKPEGYKLDQDHHNHPANQSVNFDWQFMGELMALEKIEKHFKAKNYTFEGKKTELE
jgi:hexosaminidase